MTKIAKKKAKVGETKLVLTPEVDLLNGGCALARNDGRVIKTAAVLPAGHQRHCRASRQFHSHPRHPLESMLLMLPQQAFATRRMNLQGFPQCAFHYCIDTGPGALQAQI